MFYNEYITINPNRHDRDYAETYIDTYIDTNATCKDSSYDFRAYMFKTLIYRGFLELNSENITRLFKDPIEKIFNESFRKIFLYDTQRVLGKNYKNVENVKSMNVIGNYDLISTMITPITAKYFPLIESFSISNEDLFGMIDLPDTKPEEIKGEENEPSTISELSETEPLDPSPEEGKGDETTTDPILPPDESEEGTKIEIDHTGNHLLDNNNVYSDDELNTIKTTIIEKNIDKFFVTKMHELITIIKNIFDKYSLNEIVNLTSIKAERYERTIVADIYTRLFEIMQLFAYRVSIDENLKDYITDDNKSIVMKIIEGCTKRLSECDTVMDNMDIVKYYSEIVLDGIFKDDTEFLASINDHYKIYDPVVNSQTLVTTNPSKAVVVTNFIENLISMRSIYEEADVNESSIRRLFGYFTYTAVMIIQSIFYNAYLLDDKAGMNTNAITLLGNIEPKYDSILTADTLKNLFKTFDKDIENNEIN